MSEITILCDETHICGLWIEGQAGVNSVDLSTCSTKETTILRQAEEWLTQYFEKKIQAFQACLFTGMEVHFKMLYGRNFVLFHMEQPPPIKD